MICERQQHLNRAGSRRWRGYFRKVCHGEQRWRQHGAWCVQEALRCCEASYRVFIWKEKEQKSAAGSGFLVSKGRECGGFCFLHYAKAVAWRAVGVQGGSGAESSRHEPSALAAFPFVP